MNKLVGKNPQLVEYEKTCENFVWIDNQSGFSENGLHYSQYYNTGNGGLILREAMEPSEPQSIPWLKEQAIKLGW